MSSSNYRRNKAFINQFRKELKAELGDLSEVDAKVLNRAVNEGIRWLKERTPTGLHPNPVTFTVKNGPQAGKVVSFKTQGTIVGGLLKKSWKSAPASKTASGAKKVLVNTAEYASYWNYGHRIVLRKGGPTKGFVKGTYLLEKGVSYIDRRLVALFEAELVRIKKEHEDGD